MSQNSYANIYNKVKETFEKEHLYLRADLSLNILSRVVGTNTVYLSRAINEGFGCSFNTLVNSYRLEHIIREALHSKDSVEKIAGRYGFWSRSTLYEVFKSKTGLTPHKYIEQRKKELAKK